MNEISRNARFSLVELVCKELNVDVVQKLALQERRIKAVGEGVEHISHRDLIHFAVGNHHFNVLGHFIGMTDERIGFLVNRKIH